MLLRSETLWKGFLGYWSWNRGASVTFSPFDNYTGRQQARKRSTDSTVAQSPSQRIAKAS